MEGYFKITCCMQSSHKLQANAADIHKKELIWMCLYITVQERKKSSHSGVDSSQRKAFKWASLVL